MQRRPLHSLGALALLLMASCGPLANSTSFSLDQVSANKGLEAPTQWVRTSFSDGQLFSEDNSSFKLRLFGCQYDISPYDGRGDLGLYPAGHLQANEVPLLVNEWTDAFRTTLGRENLRSFTSRRNTFVGLLSHARNIRITDRWPAEALPCSDQYTGMLLIRDIQGSDGVSLVPRNSLILRIIVAPTAALSQIANMSDIERNNLMLAGDSRMYVYDLLMVKTALTPAQQARAGSLAWSILEGLAEGMGR